MIYRVFGIIRRSQLCLDIRQAGKTSEATPLECKATPQRGGQVMITTAHGEGLHKTPLLLGPASGCREMKLVVITGAGETILPNSSLIFSPPISFNVPAYPSIPQELMIRGIALSLEKMGKTALSGRLMVRWEIVVAPFLPRCRFQNSAVL